MFDKGWTFNRDEGSTGDHLHDAATLGDIYLKTNPKYSGRVTVPVLWDKKRSTIVNNEFLRNHPHVQFGLRRR